MAEPFIKEASPEDVQSWLNNLTLESPASFPLITERTPTHHITTIYWASVSPLGGCSPSAETGVRSVRDGQVQDDFHLIQHGWARYKDAHEYIKTLLDLGANYRDIDHEVMDEERDRRAWS